MLRIYRTSMILLEYRGAIVTKSKTSPTNSFLPDQVDKFHIKNILLWGDTLHASQYVLVLL